MSYQGKNFIIPCDRGGLTANPNVDTTSAVQMIDPTKNLNLQEMGRTPRGGTSVITTMTESDSELFDNLDNWTTISGTPSLTGGYVKTGANNTSAGSIEWNNIISGDFDIQCIIATNNLPTDTATGLTYLQSQLRFTPSGGSMLYIGGGFRMYPLNTPGGVAHTFIEASGSDSFDLGAGVTSIYVRTVRTAAVFYVYYGTDGESWTLLNSMAIGTGDVTIGCYNAGNTYLSGAISSAYFDNVVASNPLDTILGVYDFTLKSGTQHIITAVDNGEVYKKAEDAIATNMSKTTFYSFATFDNTLFIADGYTTPQTWDGAAASTSDITQSASDWSGTTQPSQFVVHGRKQSERLWAIMAGTSDYNNCVYASNDGNGKQFVTGVVKFEIQTNDGFGIVAGAEFGDRIVCIGKRKAYIIDDDDTDEDNWGYEAAQWEGGVAHWRLLVKTPNDIVNMMEDGEIYSVTAAENYGDYKAASITRPSHMHTWINDNIDLSQIDKFHSVYDPKLRCIKFFMVRNGYTTVDIALCYFIDRDPREAWIRHDNLSYDSGYKAASSALVRKAVGDYRIYTGDYSGRIWALENVAKNDDDNGYYAGFKTPMVDCENPRATKNFKRLWLSIRPVGSWDLDIRWWVDGSPQTATTMSLTGGPVLGTFVLGTDQLGGIGVLDGQIDLNQNGRRVQFECYNETADESFFVNQMMIDYRELGNEPR